MQAIFNRQGQTVAWLSHKDIYDRRGNFIGYVSGHSVYNRSSRQRGTLKQSIFRNADGLVVAFMDGAKSGPVFPPIKPIPPEPRKRSKPYLKSVSSTLSVKPPKSRWSKLDWNSFI